jgi:phosphatidate cytidylyltransferase
MKSRIVSAAIALPVFLAVIYFGGNVLFAASIIVAGILLYELHNMIYKGKEYNLLIISYIYTLIHFYFQRSDDLVATTVIAYVLVVLFLETVCEDNYNLTKVTMFLVGSIYIIKVLPYLYLLDTHGISALLLPFLSAWLYDTSAYFTGIKFGKRRPWKNLSPKKSIEGLIGGVLISVTLILVYGYFNKWNLIYTAIYALGATFLAQSGDLIISAFKRTNQVKDSGKIMPGHGGLLDRFDSVMPVLPLAYLFITMISK